jgi:hypothetical protein
LRKNKVVVFFLSVCWSCLLSVGYWVLGIECWALNVGYTVIFPMPSQAKKYECWVLGIGYWVLSVGYSIEQFTVIFQYPVSQKHREYKFFSNTQYPIPNTQNSRTDRENSPLIPSRFFSRLFLFFFI